MGGAGCALNDKAYKATTNRPGMTSRTMVLMNSTLGTCTVGSGKVYWQGGGCTGGLSNISCPFFNLSGGSGSGANARAISVGGQIKVVDLEGTGEAIMSAGHGYVGTNTGTANVLGFGTYQTTTNLSSWTTTAQPGTGLQFRLDRVSVVTDGGGNKLCANGAGDPGCGSFPDPTHATAGDYMNFIKSTTGKTTDDYIAAARGQRKGNWDPLLMPNTGLNPYIRSKFGAGKTFTITNP